MNRTRFLSQVATYERDIKTAQAQAEHLRKSGYPLSAEAIDRRVVTLQKRLLDFKQDTPNGRL